MPILLAVVKAIPHLYLDDDVALGGPAQKIGKALPIRRVPAVEVVLAVGILVEGWDLIAVDAAVAHGIAHVVAADRLQQVEMGFEIGYLEEAVFDRST